MSSDGNSVLDQAGFATQKYWEVLANPTKLSDNTEAVKNKISGPTHVDGNASAVTQISGVEQNIEGAAGAGAIDPQTAQELRGQLAGQGNSYDYSVGQIGSIQSRLDAIAAGADPTVNDRLRLQNTLLNLKDRPGRAGLVTGG